MKLLALHGLGNSASIFQQQIQRAKLDRVFDRHELDFLDGPMAIPSADLPARVLKAYAGPHYGWYTMSQVQAGKAFDPIGDPVLQYVTDHVQQHGPYDGVLAFSQGAMVIGLLLTLRRMHQSNSQDDGLGRFVVSFAGGPYGAPFPDCMPPASLPEPSLHFIGDRDPVRKSSEELLSTFQRPLLVRHAGGHVVPQLQGPDLETLTSFLQAQQQSSNL